MYDPSGHKIETQSESNVVRLLTQLDTDIDRQSNSGDYLFVEVMTKSDFVTSDANLTSDPASLPPHKG